MNCSYKTEGGTNVAVLESMQRKYKLMVTIALVVLAIAFAAAFAFDSIAIAYGALVTAVVFAFITGISHFRPSGRVPEHHTKVDRFVDDTRP